MAYLALCFAIVSAYLAKGHWDSGEQFSLIGCSINILITIVLGSVAIIDLFNL